MIVEFDIRTPDSARTFISEFTGMTEQEYDIEIVNNIDRFELLWNKLFDQIQAIDISDLRIIAFHIVGSLDECKEIEENGLMDLRKVLSKNTVLGKELKKAGVKIDIENKLISCNDKSYMLSEESSGKLFLVSNRLLNDYCVNGFLCNDDIFGYGDDVCKRPEFLKNISELFPEIQTLEEFWKRKSKSYKINFYATLNQISEFTFNLYNVDDSLSDDMKIKKSLLWYALNRALDNFGTEKFLYIKKDISIPSKQITKIDELNCIE